MVALLAGIATRINTFAAPVDQTKNTDKKDKVAVQDKINTTGPKQNKPKVASRVDTQTNGKDPAMQPNPALPATVGGDPYYDILVLGIDRRPHQKTGRSDVILIVHCEANQVTLFSIPRDTLTKVRKHLDKINHAYAYGGINLSKASIENLLKFKVDNYFILDFETFLKTIDMVKTLTDDGRLIGAENFLISGDNLLKWLRFRTLPGGDWRRAQRHQLFFKRIMEYGQNMYRSHPTVFEQVIKGGLKIGTTDLTYAHIEKLMAVYKDYKVDDTERFVLLGHPEMRLIGGDKPEHRIPQPAIDPNAANNPQPGNDPNKPPAAEEESDGNEASYFVPNNNWSLAQYLKHYRAKGLKINYKEVDTLRK